jgi:hypothetical protein
LNEARLSYAVDFVRDSLGLVDDSLKAEDLPVGLVDDICTVTKGVTQQESSEPFIEKELLSFSAWLQESDLDRHRVHLRKARWPDGRQFGVCLTHDVDNVGRPLAHLWKTRDRFAAKDLVLGLLGLRSVYNNIALIARHEMERKVKSSFYFLTSNYPLEELRGSAEDLVSRGWDIGLHGDFGTHDSAEKMQQSMRAFEVSLGFRPKGIREHYLKFDFAKTWEILESQEFDYDSSVGMSDRLGFRLGLATPFHPPDKDWAKMRLLELPLTLMDTTLWGYLRLKEADGKAAFARMLSSVEAVGGLFTLLWHQEAVRMKGGRLYWTILDELAGRDCFIADGATVSKWWRSRSESRLIREASKYRANRWPPDLRLLAKLSDGVRINLTNCVVEKQGEMSLVRGLGPDFTVEVM